MSNPSATALKASALKKLSEAHTLILSAREDLCNLEGPGYCQTYERILATADDVQRMVVKLRNLQAPTGVFTI